MAASPDTAAPTQDGSPSPKSPPKYPDFCGRHRLHVEVQILNREITFLEEELQSLEASQAVSRCCKEVDDFLRANPDPFIPQNTKKPKTCSFLKSLRSNMCNFSWLCCSCPCSSLRFRRPNRCSCESPRDCSCCSGSHTCFYCNCFRNCCVWPHCGFTSCGCSRCSCSCVWYCCPSCKEQGPCYCAKACCSSHCVC